jgi:hypothetical protein
MTYRQVLDEAIGDSPVSTVDVDAVINRQRRAGKLRRWGACGTGAAAVLAVIATVTQMLPRDTLIEPAEGPPITTVADTPEDLARLDAAVFTALEREVPGLKWADPAAPAILGWVHENSRENPLVGYRGQGPIDVGGTRADLIVDIERNESRKIDKLRCAKTEKDCRETAGPHGERIWTVVPARGIAISGQQLDGFLTRSVEVLRPSDDMLVRVMMLVELPPAEPIAAMTPEQQTAIALDPALALAPVPPAPSGAPAPSGSPGRPAGTGADTQQQRIDNAVFASVRRQAPEADDLAANWIDSGGDNTADAYFGQGQLQVNGVAGLFSVQMERGAHGAEDVKCGKNTKSYTCESGRGPRGEKYRAVTNTTRNGSATSATRDVSVLRKDGTWLLVSLNANPPGGKFPLSAAAQKAIALDSTIDLGGR